MSLIHCEHKEIKGQFVTVIHRRKPKMKSADTFFKPQTKESDMAELEKHMPRGEKSVAAHGDNSDKLLKDYVTKCANLMGEMESKNSDLKEVLRSAKNDGFLKTSIRNAVKELRMTTEQRDSRKEIDEMTARYTELCRDLPLFKQAA